MSEWVHLITVEGDVDKTQLESLLRSEKIECVMQAKENSDFLRVYMGGTHSVTDVLVQERDLVRARELLEAFSYEIEEEETEE